MTSVQQLIADVTSLSVEAKRRNTEVKSACDNSLNVLNKFNSNMDIGSPDFAPDLNDKETLVKPFLISIIGGNVKFATLSIPTLLRLMATRVFPSELLSTLLNNLKEASHLGADIQLRILQCLPSIMQVYGDMMHGELLKGILVICTNLTTTNRSTVVINTALATLQQLFGFIFDNVRDQKQVNQTKSIIIDNDEELMVSEVSYEGYQILYDLSLLASGDTPNFLPKSIFLRDISVLELIESVVSSHEKLFKSHKELSFLLRQKIVPVLLRNLNNPKKSLPLVIRVLRIVQVILNTQIETTEVESEVILSYFIHTLTKAINETEKLDDETPSNDEDSIDWEQLLILEVLRNVFQNFNIVRLIFEKYDEVPESRNILQDIFTTLNLYYQKFSLPRNQFLELESKSNLYLSKKSSSIKISIMDHLDKQELPVLPSTYSSYLILQILLVFSEGIAKFVTELSSSNSSSSTLEADVGFISLLIESTYPDASNIYENLMYTPIDNDLFHQLIRSLQKYTHTSGLLGLGTMRDGLLTLLAKAIINNNKVKNEDSQDSSPKNLLALGEQLMESFAGTSSDGDSEPQFNQRHITCLRAMVNLAVSLGSTLEQSWKIIWITFQWCDFFTDGPDKFSVKNNNESKTHRISTNNMTIIENSRKKLHSSIKEYPRGSFLNLAKALSELSMEVFSGRAEQVLVPCAFNKAFFLTKLTDLSKLDPRKFFINDSKNWNLIKTFFIKTCSNRSLQSNLRLFAVEEFNSIIHEIANCGFSQGTEVKTAKLTLDALESLVSGLFDLVKSDELLVSNAELDIHLASLVELHSLIDKYDKFYVDSYETVFEILNTPFKISLDANVEKSTQIYETAISTLKLIIDEFLVSLPFDQLRILIDTLFNFATHKINLNYSFSAVSYFWLASDTIKTRITDSKEKTLPNLKNETELVDYLESCSNPTPGSYELLEVYLLLTVSKIAEDSRPHLRNDAISTFFSILDVYGRLLVSWELIYEITFSRILNLKLDITSQDFDKKEWIGSLENILKGLVWFYTTNMKGMEKSVYLKYWNGLISYFTQLLDLKWVDLNMIIFKSLKEILESFKNTSVSTKSEIGKLLFTFWISIPIEYDFVNPLYQESLTTLMDCFPPLYSIVKDELSVEDSVKVLNNFNSCARYPILQDGYQDETKPSKLQQAVYLNFKALDRTNTLIMSNCIQQLSSISVFPFAVRERIEKKLGANLVGKFKTPSFIGISTVSTELIQEILESPEIIDLLMKDKGILKVMKSLLEIVREKFQGSSNTPLWITANLTLRNLITRILASDKEIYTDLWVLILSTIELSLNNVDPTFEEENINHYNSISPLIIPKLANSSETKLIEEFVIELYEKSFLFNINEHERSLAGKSQQQLLEMLTNYEYEFTIGSTSPLEVVKSRKTALTCLQELIKFASDPTNLPLNTMSLKYFIIRSLITLNRFIFDQSLLNRGPLPQVQQNDMKIILEGIIHMRKSLGPSKSESILVLKPYIIKAVSFASKANLEKLIEKTLDSF